uniref:Uncharacterized protein n=1 Tax=Ciona intestinalis TaxID=7719 RepID=H2XJR9_CIOIN
MFMDAHCIPARTFSGTDLSVSFKLNCRRSPFNLPSSSS